MAFWSSQTLEAKVRDQGLIRPPRVNAVDCNAYTLCVGAEIYVTPTLEQGSASTHTKVRLSEGEPFTIPAGQFAFLMSEESVEVPTNAMAFISIKARIKFRGLVNVSGFHVDSGFHGRLKYSVFNAGSENVILQRGERASDRVPTIKRHTLINSWWARRKSAFAHPTASCQFEPSPVKGAQYELVLGLTGTIFVNSI